MTKIYGYDTNIYETSIGNIKCFNESCSKEDIEKAMTNKSFFEMALEEKDNKIIKLQSNWNSLREFVIQLQKLKGINQQGFSWGVAQEVLDKMNELESSEN